MNVDLSEVNSLETEEADEIRSIVQSAMYAGPLPPPQMLHQLRSGPSPVMADRIMSMAEKEQAIRSRDNGWLVFNDFARVFGSVVVSFGLSWRSDILCCHRTASGRNSIRGLRAGSPRLSNISTVRKIHRFSSLCFDMSLCIHPPAPTNTILHPPPQSATSPVIRSKGPDPCRHLP